MNVLIVPGLTLPDVTAEQLAQMQEAAGADATLTVARDREGAVAGIVTADVMLGPLNPAMFAVAERLKWVHAIASGVDGYLFPEFRDSDVTLTGEKGLVGGHLADHAFALLLAVTRGLGEAVKLGPDAWGPARMGFRRTNIELDGLTMGVVGFGGTGRAIAKRAAAFGMVCQAVDINAMDGSAEVDEVRTMDALDDLLRTSDVVAIGLPLTEETRELFDARAFGLMKATAIIVNVTRGEIIDGDALAVALNDGVIGGAALDVVPEEPLPADHALWSAPNIVMTPHTAGASQLRAQRNLDRFCTNLGRFRAGEPLDGMIDKQLGF